MADGLNGVAAGGGAQGHTTARFHPLAGHAEVLKPREGLLHAEHVAAHGVVGEQPAARGALPIAGVALIAERSGNIDHFDISTDAGVNFIELVNDLAGQLVLFAVIHAAPVDALEIVVVVAQEHFHDRLALGRQGGVKAEMHDAEHIALIGQEGEGLVG